MSKGLEFAAVRRRFGDVCALERLDLDCPAGAMTCLVGPNGAGKSTALALAAGLLAPTAGTLRFDRREVAPRRAPPSTGYLPQRSAFHPALKAGEVIDFTFAARRASAGERRRALELTGLAAARDRFVGALSGGWVRRLGLLAALAGSPRLLLLDEPFAGLDPETHDRLLEHLAGRLDAGATLLLATHDFEAADPFAPRVAVLDEGRLLACAAVGGDLASGREVYRRALGAAPPPRPVEAMR